MPTPGRSLWEYVMPIQDPELMGEAQAIAETTTMSMRDAINQARVNRFLRNAEADYSHGVESDTFTVPMTREQWYEAHMRWIREGETVMYPLTSLVDGASMRAFEESLRRQGVLDRLSDRVLDAVETWLLGLANWVAEVRYRIR